MRRDLTEAITNRLAPAGFNLVGAASVADYDALVPELLRLAIRMPWARSAVVIGNGGGDFWRAFARRCAEDPAAWNRRDPIDAFTRETLEPAIAELLEGTGVRGRLVFPFEFAAEPISFMDLGRAAGLGSPSLLGVLVHPRFGPWMALRAAVLVDAVMAAERPAAAFDPCPSCVERPCLAACPAGAVSVAGSWDWLRCIDHRRAGGDCVDRCHARMACVYGRDQRYPDAALEYHQRCAWNAMREGPPGAAVFGAPGAARANGSPARKSET